MIGVSNHSCCSCTPNPCSNCPPKCKPITSADLATLVYIGGLDVNYCPKYQEVADVLGLVDCNGDPIVPGQPVVTCAQMQEQLCEIFAAFVSGGALVPGTVVVGANCQTYTMPAFQAPLVVADTACIDLTLAANTLSAAPIISPTAGNSIECTANGLYVPDVCEQLSDITVPVVPADDTTVLVTAGCNRVNLTSYQGALTVADTPCLDLTLVGDTLSGAPVISPTAGNQLSCSGNGLFVPAPPAETPLTVVDTPSVNLTASGTANHTLQADVIISPDAGNSAEIHPNGVYVPDVCTQFGDIVGVVVPADETTVFVDRDCNLVSLPAVTEITVDDTVTIDLTLTGGEITGDVNVSGVAGNALTVLGDGLYVPTVDANVTITGVDTNCIDTTVVEGPANVFSISSAPIISPTAGNTLTCTANGLYVPTTGTPDCSAIVGQFTDSADALDPGDNVLVDDCNTYQFPNFLPADTQSIDMSVTRDGSGNFVFSGNAIIAPTATGFPASCNGLQVGAGGLFVNPDHDGQAFFTDAPAPVFTGPITAGTVFTSPSFSMNITNPSTCRSSALILAVRLPQVEWTAAAAPTKTQLRMFRTINFPSSGIITTGVGNWTLRSVDTTGDFFTTANVISPLVIPPGESGTLSVTLEINQLIGNLSNLTIDFFILRAWSYTIS